MVHLTMDYLSILVAIWTQILVISFVSGSQCTFKNQHNPHPAMKKIVKLSGKRYSIKDDLGTYTYSVGICTDAESPENPSPQAGIVQRTVASPQTSAVTVGKYDSVNFMPGHNWILLEYLDGDKYTGGKCGNGSRRGSIMFLCDADQTEGVLHLVEENTGRNNNCYFLFEFTHAAICSDEVIAANRLSTGSIFVIVFGSVVGLYLVVGVLYKRFVAGAKGWEQIPNHGFWQDFGNLLADGCELVCRSGQPASINRYQPVTTEYRGIGDDQLQETDDFDTDEHLLPM